MKDSEQEGIPHFPVNPHLVPQITALKASGEPVASALAVLIEQQDVTSQEVRWQSPRILKTKQQAEKTNGRVSKVERLIFAAKVISLTIISIIVIIGACKKNEGAAVLSDILKLIVG